MSFILDALKKSETERLRKDAPGIASIPESGRQKSSTRWIWLVLALITVNLVVLAGLMMKVNQETVTTDAPLESLASATQPESAVVRTEDIAEPDLDVPTMATTENTSEQPVAENSAPPETPDSTQTASFDRGLDTFNDLRANGTLMLPDMHLDIHVYSGDAADRFVFVNMSKYKENATLAEGPVVSEITPDGVILSYQGSRFLLPRE
jgi:general secretion pathway protein B